MKDRQDGMTRRHYLAATSAGALALGFGPAAHSCSR
jgi:hypothetical protein